MKELKFKYAKAVNFLCFGSSGIEINFEKMSNIVVVRANNLDCLDNGSNGAGKTSYSELPVYALFGQTIKKPKKLGHTEVLNNQAKTEMSVEFAWDDCKVVRILKPGKKIKAELRFWKGGKEVTLGSIAETQKSIEKEIGLTYDSFINIYVFSADNSKCFLECDTPTKREIVENLLSLEKYRNYWDISKVFLKELKDKIKLFGRDYENLTNDLSSARIRLVNVEKQETEWKNRCEQELNTILVTIKKKRTELKGTDSGVALAKFNDAQEQIVNLNQLLPELDQKKTNFQNILNEVIKKQTSINENCAVLSTEISKFINIVNSYDEVIKRNEKIVSDIEGKIGKDCPYCLGEVDESKFEGMLRKAREEIELARKSKVSNMATIESLRGNLGLADSDKKKIDISYSISTTKLGEANKEISKVHVDIVELSKVKEPKSSAEEQRIQGQIEELKNQAILKKREVSPYTQIKETCSLEILEKGKNLAAKKKEIEVAESEVPYFEFWVKAFGDTGIRKYVIDGIIPALNSRIAYWLQFLIDNRIKLEFNNQLEETIDRYPFHGRPYVYHGMSGGQRQRLNLTVSQAFAYIRMLNCGASPSVVFLDEVTMNMDSPGVVGIYKMICELAKEKQVFIIDHNPELLGMLAGCETVTLEMKNEITTVVS